MLDTANTSTLTADDYRALALWASDSADMIHGPQTEPPPNFEGAACVRSAVACLWLAVHDAPDMPADQETDSALSSLVGVTLALSEAVSPR